VYRSLRFRLRRGDDRVARLIRISFIAAVIVGCGGRVGGLSSPIATTRGLASAPTPAPSALVSATLPPAPGPTANPGSTAPSAAPSFWTEDATSRDDDHQSATYLQLTVTDARWGVIAIQTAADTRCVAGGQYPSGTQIYAAGLGQKRADGSGRARWTFALTPAEHGAAIYTLSCSAGQSMRTVRVHFLIS
jgi:hypothetical protein